VEMAKVAFVTHPDREDAKELARAHMIWLAELGHQSLLTSRPPLPEDCDLVVSLGGDGTMLRAVGMALGLKIPVMGVNLGRLGYLTPVEPRALRDELGRFLAGQVVQTERSVIEAELPPKGEASSRLAFSLNEVVLERVEPGHTIRVLLGIDGRPFVSLAADGVIVATPTGSSAYNFSAHGPVVSPELDVMVVTPVCPHNLFDRSLVLPGLSEVSLELLAEREARVVVDGISMARLAPGSKVLCRGSMHRARLVGGSGDGFHSLNRDKFGLTSS